MVQAVWTFRAKIISAAEAWAQVWVFHLRPSLALRNSQILRNTDGVSGGISASGADGGGVYCAESNLSMENATIQDNHAGAASDGVTYGKNGGYGGGLFAYACNMTISQSDILDNLAGQGSNGTGAGSGGPGGGNFLGYGWNALDHRTLTFRATAAAQDLAPEKARVVLVAASIPAIL